MSPFKKTGVTQLWVVPKSKFCFFKPDCSALTLSQSLVLSSGLVFNISNLLSAPATSCICKDLAKT